jgi:hypothetical protein
VVRYQVQSEAEWAESNFAAVELGDARLNRRAVKVASSMAADPSSSIPQQNKRWSDIKGAYRLFDHDQVTFESISQRHWDQTRELAGQCAAVTLLIQDTTWLSFASHPATVGLGRYGGKTRQSNKMAGHGLFLHSVLAVEPGIGATGQVLGLAHGKLWARDEKVIGAKGKKRAKRRCSDDRESMRWAQAVGEVGAPPEGHKFLHVGDRESDIYELYEQTQEQAGVGFVVRLAKARGAEAGHDHSITTLTSRQRPKTKLKEVCRAMPELGRTNVWVAPRGGRREGRWAKLSVSGSAVTIYSPWFGPGGSRTARPLRCWAVRVVEVDAPDGVVEPLEWLLLTSEPVNHAADALRIAEYYSLRWLIEEYHKCLKSGCKIEQRQLESADRLEPLIGMSSIVATRLLQLKNNARLTPDRPASECVPNELVQTLRMLRKLKASTMTVRQFTHEVAKLGGFIGRKSDGEPGWQTLWQGWRELSLVNHGYQLAQRTGRYG